MGVDLVGYLMDIPRKQKFTAQQTNRMVRKLTGSVSYGDVPLSAEDAREVVTRLADGWFPEDRYTCVRAHPTDRKRLLLFSGDMTWGEPDDSEAYAYFDCIHRYGLNKAFDIR